MSFDPGYRSTPGTIRDMDPMPSISPPIETVETAITGTLDDNEGPSQSAIDLIDHVLDEVDRSLGRIDKGRYGRCETCNELIDDDLLASHPMVRNCGTCPPPGDENPPG